MTTRQESQAIDQQLIEMHRQSIPRKEQANRLGMDISSIDRRRALLNLSRDRSVPDEVRQRIVNLKRGGATHSEVSRITGVSQYTIKDVWGKAKNPEVPKLSIPELLKQPVNQFLASNWKRPVNVDWQHDKPVTVEASA
ncbi:hypothetical protein [Endozoicomonas ascidiicola]|uniref:hypothetical protein n=1 Tax=Endozoicomonas ascidiicola TaxID=1698521 RepID=UPI000830526C|nr:hypothetical protein [Endozoicomonas ascidiicola]